jgi:hypothetical protein
MQAMPVLEQGTDAQNWMEISKTLGKWLLGLAEGPLLRYSVS